METLPGSADDIGRWVTRLDRVGSTMDVAWELAAQGAPHGAAVVAKAQTAGRGRFARQWVSGEDESLLISVLLHPGAQAAPLLSAMAALAASDAAEEAAGVACELKWPNDVLAGGRKLCGILIEVRADTEGGVSAVLGVGLNVNLDLAARPELQDAATSLAEQSGLRLDIQDVENAFLAKLRERYRQCMDDGPSTLADWAARLSTLGRRVTVRERDGAVTGMAESVDDTGRLIVRLASGARRALSEGDVTLAE